GHHRRRPRRRPAGFHRPTAPIGRLSGLYAAPHAPRTVDPGCSRPQAVQTEPCPRARLAPAGAHLATRLAGARLRYTGGGKRGSFLGASRAHLGGPIRARKPHVARRSTCAGGLTARIIRAIAAL